MKRNDSSVTLLELMVVLIIVATLAILALPQLRVARENALDKEAQANLKLIQAAEKIYRMEASFYTACADRVVINQTLLLDIPSTTNWNYRVQAVPVGLFTGSAQRISDNRVWCVQRDTVIPYDAGGGCTY